MGVVYAVQHELLFQKVALKLMRPALGGDPRARVRFLNEARNASRIQSDYVVRVLDVGLLDSDVPFMVMELLEGADLAAIMRDQMAPLPIAQTVDWLLEVVDAIAHAHAIGIVHRDLKPSNLFLSQRPDGTRRIKVLDFGISKASHRPAALGITRTDAVLGTPLYMSPEQLRGAKGVDAHTDIWALGVVAYQLFTGHLPFRGDNAVALFVATTETTPVPLRRLRDEIPEGLEKAVLRCLQREPAGRFARVGELGAALAPYGTIAATQTLARALCITYPSPSASSPVTLGEDPPDSPVKLSVSLPKMAPTDLRTQSSNEGTSGVGQSVVPWSADEGPSTPQSLDESSERPTQRARATTAMPLIIALAVVGGASYGMGRFHGLRALDATVETPGAALAPEGSARDGSKAVDRPPFSSLDATETSTANAVPAMAIDSAAHDAAPPGTAARGLASPNRPSPFRRHSELGTALEAPGAFRSWPAPNPSEALPGSPTEGTMPTHCNPPYVIDASGHRQYKPECP
jgi:serine/threonine-protein kinase